MEITKQKIVGGPPLESRQAIEDKRIATWDSEANGFLEEATIAWCVCIVDHQTDELFSFGPDAIRDALEKLDTYDVLVSHNGIDFDHPLMERLYGWDYKGERVDTLLMSRTQRPNRELPPTCPRKTPEGKLIGPNSVEAYGHRFGDYKLAHNEWDKYSPEMLERCQQDTRVQRKIYDYLLKEGAGEGWEQAHKLNAKLFQYLGMQSRHGWLVDQQHIHRSIGWLDRGIARIDSVISPRLPLVVEVEEQKHGGVYGWLKKPFKINGEYSKACLDWLHRVGLSDLSNVVGGPFSRLSFRVTNLDSNEEVKAFLLALGWEPQEWNTNDAGERTSPKLSKDDDFNGIQGSLGKLVAKRVKCRHRRSNLEGWLEAIRPDGRISARVGGVAATGRLKHAVIVNVPSPNSKAFFAKQMRQVFTVPEGYTLVGTDSKSNQSRQLAALMGDPEYTAELLSGRDIHEYNQKKTGAPSRNVAKNLYYGYIFGLGDKKAGAYVNGGAKEGKELKAGFEKGLPLFGAMLERLRNAWKETAQQYWSKQYHRMEYRNGYIRGLDGRPILVEFEKDILAYYLQSMEAIQMGVAYCWLHKQCFARGWEYGKDFGFCIWMHDEFQAEIRDELVAEYQELAYESIAWAGRWLNIGIEHEGDNKYGLNWFETH